MRRHLILGVAIELGILGVCLGQDRTDLDQTGPRYSTSVEAEQAAERLVAMSPENIIALLRAEPGLLLQVKKLLVRTAYEQGRLLDPQDLTDEALFRLVREDANIRVLATREIERRDYIRAKPNRDERLEMAREQANLPALAGSRAAPAESQPAAGKAQRGQEETYWQKRDDDLLRGGPASPAPSGPVQPVPAPESPSIDDPRRQLERTSVESFGDAGDLPRVSPEQLRGLLNPQFTEASGIMRPGGTDRASMGYSPAGPLALPTAEASDFPNDRLSQPSRPNGKTPPRLSDSKPDHPIIQHRSNPYADVPSLYDLYAQYSKASPQLDRFGMDVFRNGTGNLDELPMDMPVGPDYVLGPGDGLKVDIWGSVSQRLARVVDREGRVSLPEVGMIEVSGRSLGDVQHMVQAALRTNFREVQADVSLARLRTVRVYVVGDVERPGAYDVSSLSTPLNALYAALGPTSRGSLRLLRHYRGQQLVQEVDVYDLLLHGMQSKLERLQPGDTLLVPPLGPQVTIVGMVRRPAIYELHGEKTLSEVLELAGGVLSTGTLRQIEVERLAAHEQHSMLRLDLPDGNNQDAVNKALDDFQVQSDDKINIWPILPYSEKTVYLDGHVFRPGKYAYRDGMRVSDVIKSYDTLLPEPHRRHAEVIRLTPPDYTPQVIAFNLDDALAGNEQDVALKPFDTIRIFGRYQFEDPPVISVTGEVRSPGDHVTNGGSRLSDAIYLAGGTTEAAQLDDVQVFRKTETGGLKVISVNLAKAMAGDAQSNIVLRAADHIVVHHNLARTDPPAVLVQGEVAHPGKYPLGADMSAADLVRTAGGLKRSADAQEADLTRYVGQSGSTTSEHLTIQIAEAMAGKPDVDVRLHDGDVLTIRQKTGWADIGSTIAVKGEVVHPGTYGIQEGERLSSILARAGGLRPDAYPFGAVFEREQLRQMEDRNRDQLIQEIQDEGASLKLIPETDEDQRLAKQASLLQWKSTLDRLQNTPSSGRLVVHISSDVRRWANTPADIQVRAGDSIYIPKKSNLVIVDGAVYNRTAVTFKPGKNAGWYLSQAGGPNNMANKRAIFVIRADGSVAGGASGIFSGGALDAELQPGDLVMVPEKTYSGTSKWKNAVQSAQVVSAIGIAVQVARSF